MAEVVISALTKRYVTHDQRANGGARMRPRTFVERDSIVLSIFGLVGADVVVVDGVVCG